VDSTLLERIQDIRRFLITFHTPISISAPHIYISTGPFLPSQSPLSRTFSREFTSAIKVRAGSLSSWPAPPLEWTGHAGAIQSISYSPDGTHVVTGSSDRTIRIWDAETGAEVGSPLKGHTDSVWSVAYSPDGRRIISGSGSIFGVGSTDNTIRIWDAETGAEVGSPLKGHTDSVLSVAYSPDGRRIVSGSYDRTIRIWDAETGTEVGSPLKGHTDSVRSVAYSPDGRRIISGSGDRTIRTWGSEVSTEASKPHEEHTYSVRPIGHSSDAQHTVSDAFLYASIRRSSYNPLPAGFFAEPDMDGWVRGSEGGLLYWVPHDYRKGLHSPALLTLPLTSHHRSVSLDFDDFAFGTSWTQMFINAPS